MKPADWLPEIVRLIVQASDPDKIVLFGSYAQDAAGSDSDLDLLVILSHSDRLRQDSWRIRRALRGLLIPIDIVVATSEQGATTRSDARINLPDGAPGREGAV